MGHIRTPKFELQIEKTDNSVAIIGVNSINEAKREIKNSYEYKNSQFYIH